MKNFLLQYRNLAWEKKILAGGLILALIPVLAATFWRSDPLPTEPRQNGRRSVDTYIPKGFVLVPIDVQNYEALDSILGPFAYVDLMQARATEGSRPHLVARNVRLLRAPQNPSHFAILVEEQSVNRILQHGSQFTVLIRARTHSGTEIEKAQRTIVYEGGS